MMSLNLPPSTPAVNASAGTNPFSNFGTATSASSVPFSTTNTAFSNPFSSNATAVGANPFDTATPSFGAAAQPNTTSLATTTFQPSTTLLANTTSQPSTQTSSFMPTVTAQTTLTNNPQSNPLYILENLQLAYDPKSPYCKFKHVFYNVVPEGDVARYLRPEGFDDALWQQALQENPDPLRMVPVLAIGFDDLNGRIQVQNKRIALYKERCHELDARLDVLLRKQQTDTETSLIIIRQKYRALFKVILQLMIALERLRKGPSSSLSDRVEADLRGQILELARKVSGDQSLSLRLNQLSEMLLQTQPLFEDNSHLLGNTQRPPSVFCLEDSALSEQAVKAKMSFLELLEEQQKAIQLLIQSCLTFDEEILGIQSKLRTLRQ